MLRCLAPLLLAAGTAQAQGVFGSPSHFTEQGGAAIYQYVCAACHMADGQGAAGAYPSLRQDAALADAAATVALVLHGRRAMPGFARTLDDLQIADVVDYVCTHFGNDLAGATTPETVGKIRQ
jgi:mono/diheme cytochrome c family protein